MNIATTNADAANLVFFRNANGGTGAGNLHQWMERAAVNASWPLAKAWSRPQQMAVGILMYHRLTPRRVDASTPTWSVTPNRFGAQLRGLLKRGYRAWPLRRVLEYQQAGRATPPKTFVITFDDGYENNYTQAWPILRELQTPATIFLATAYLDSSQAFPFDDWPAAGRSRSAAEAWRPLSTDQCREMQRSGVIEFGCHTHTHQDFRSRPDVLASDVATCLQELQNRFGIEAPPFAFPYGMRRQGFSGGALTDAVRNTGVSCALSTECELADLRQDPFQWGRLAAHQHDTGRSLSAKLSGWHTTLRNLWKSCSHTDSGRGEP